jgi:ADP-heptose:LPS heptosyltransferase
MTGPTGESAVTLTRVVEFRAKAPFEFRQHNVAVKGQDRAAGGQVYYTTAEAFANAVLARAPEQFRILDPGKRLASLAPAHWPGFDFGAKRVLFLLPAQALGEAVAMFLFLQAVLERYPTARLAVACAQSAADIYALDGRIELFTLWIAKKRLQEFDALIDLGQVAARRNIDIWPVDMEAELLTAFDLAPSASYGSEPRRIQGKEALRIGILPLATSPLRTLPITVTLALVAALKERGHVTLSLNRDQQQGRLYAGEVAGRLGAEVTLVDGFASIGALMAAIRDFDYAVFADSGPAHIAKLFQTPGVAVYSSAPGDVLQGRFTNLARWTVPYVGPYCAAPCGLAKLRQTAAGRVGCMGSLGLGLDLLPATARGHHATQVERLLLQDPVPCIRHLRDDPEPLVEFVLNDLRSRLRT